MCHQSLAKQKAEILNAQFTTVFSEPLADIDYTELALNSKMTDIAIVKNGVHKQLNSWNPHKAAMPNGISPRVLRELADVLEPPLTTLFQAFQVENVLNFLKLFDVLSQTRVFYCSNG